MDRGSDRLQIDQVVDALETGVGSAVDRDILAAVVEADFDRYAATARIKAFVPDPGRARCSGADSEASSHAPATRRDPACFPRQTVPS